MTADDANGARPPVLNLLNVLVLLGILVVVVGVVYFAGTFVRELSEWGKLLILLLATAMFIGLGAAFEDAPAGGALVDRRGFRWLRVQTAFFLLGGVAGLVTVIFFVSMDAVDARAKVLVTIVVGLALIVGAAYAQSRRGAARGSE